MLFLANCFGTSYLLSFFLTSAFTSTKYIVFLHTSIHLEGKINFASICFMVFRYFVTMNLARLVLLLSPLDHFRKANGFAILYYHFICILCCFFPIDFLLPSGIGIYSSSLYSNRHMKLILGVNSAY